jgi:hypothetical protein
MDLETVTDQLTIELPGDDVIAQAEISKCGVYRYTLWRHWQTPMLGTVTWIMLNPSWADAVDDDPTIRKCIGFSKKWGFGGIRVVNLFALRSEDFKKLAQHDDPVGPQNDEAINTALDLAGHDGGPAVAAWGRNSKHRDVIYRGAMVYEMAQSHEIDLQTLGSNQDGSPKHPLMLPYSTPLEGWPNG